MEMETSTIRISFQSLSHFYTTKQKLHSLDKGLTCGQHDGRVTVVGAADDSSDDHRAMGQLVLLPAVDKWNQATLLLFGNVEPLRTHLECTTTHP